MKAEAEGVDLAKYSLLEKLYSRLREQSEHENDLYNQRIIWLITLQALLYATVGLIIQGVLTTDYPSRLIPIRNFFILVCILGIVVSMISSRLLSNARDSLEEIGEMWTRESSAIAGADPVVSQFPHVLGGRRVKRHGSLLRSGNLPWLFAISWVASAVILFPLTASVP